MEIKKVLSDKEIEEIISNTNLFDVEEVNDSYFLGELEIYDSLQDFQEYFSDGSEEWHEWFGDYETNIKDTIKLSTNKIIYFVGG